MFFGSIGKTRWPPWPLIGLDIFDFSSETAEQNTTKLGQEARSQRPLPSLCFSGRSEKQDGCPCLWLAETFSTSPLKPAERNSTKLDRKQDVNVLYQVRVFQADRKKTRWPPWPLIRWDIFDFSSETTERNSTKLDRKQDLNVPFQVCVFGPIEKTGWPPWPLIGWDIFDFSSETAESNSTKLEGSKISTSSTKVCVFRADWKNKMAALDSDWLRHFRLLLWNCWTEFNETWQEARFQRPLPSLCFSGRLEKQDGRPGHWLAETFSTSPLKPLNGIQQNLTGSKILMSSTKFVIFGPISKQKCPPWSIFQRGGTLNSGARYVALWASCFLILAIPFPSTHPYEKLHASYRSWSLTRSATAWNPLWNIYTYLGEVLTTKRKLSKARADVSDIVVPRTWSNVLKYLKLPFSCSLFSLSITPEGLQWKWHLP